MYYLCKFSEDKFISKSPNALTKREADSLLSVAKSTHPDFDWKVIPAIEADKLS